MAEHTQTIHHGKAKNTGKTMKAIKIVVIYFKNYYYYYQSIMKLVLTCLDGPFSQQGICKVGVRAIL